MDFNVRITNVGTPIHPADAKVVYRTAKEFREMLVKLVGDDAADLRMLSLDAGKVLKITRNGVTIEARKV